MLVLLSFRQAPGKIVADTKLDLVVDPVRMLGRSLRLWQPDAAFGHIANQAVGYLFPMGPFFALGHLLALPGWIVQRAWMATLLVVALWGAVRVMEELGVGTPPTRLVAGAAYALSPAMLVLIAHQSGGQVPGALLPWVLLPLVQGTKTLAPRRAAARSGLAVVAMGAVNAASTAAVLPLPLLWLLTRQRGPRRAALLRWWTLCVGLASLWWLVALLLQGRYGADFITFTERASATTSTTSAVEVVRGMGQWLAYLFVGGAWLPGGWALASVRVAVAATVVLAAGGLYGMARRDAPERQFLGLAVLAGAAVIGAGYAGPLGSAFSGPVRDLLDGALAPIRNVHKFEPVLRLPLAIGLAHALGLVRVGRVERLVVAAVAVAVLAAAAWPLTRGELAPPGGFDRVPAYWGAATDWLEQAGDGRTLLLPAAAFGEYRWGRPLDEPLQALLRRPWAARNLVPLSAPGATRLLDAIEDRMARGEASAGLAPVLARAGIQYVLVRNDLDPYRVATPPLVDLRRSLAGSPGLELAAAFGPGGRTGLTTDRLPPDLGSAVRRDGVQALEIWRVEQPAARAVAYPASGALVVSGGPEALLTLADAGELDGRAAFLAGDRGADVARQPLRVVTDTPARRDVDFAAVRDARSYTLTATELAPDTGAAAQDRLAMEGASHQANVQMTGAVALRASSYGPDQVRLPESQPFGAFDGDLSSAWVPSGFLSSYGQWIEVTVARPIEPRFLSIRVLRDHPWRTRITRVRIDTERASVTRRVLDSDDAQRLALPVGPTRRVRLTILGVEGSSPAGIRELSIPGVRIDRRLALPSDQRTPDLILLDRSRSDPYDSSRSDEEPRLRRRLVLPSTGPVTATGTATPRPGTALDALIAGDDAPTLEREASSTWRELPAFGVDRLFDGDAATAWVASPDDGAPTVNLTWSEVRTLSSLRIRAAAGPVLRPTHLRLVSPFGGREVDVPESGAVEFPPLDTDQVTVTVVTTSASGVAGAQGLVTPPAAALAELRFPALADLEPVLDRERVIDLPCGEGPVLTLDGESVATRAAPTVGELLDLRAVPFTACEATTLAKGTHRIDSANEGVLAVATVALARGDTTRPSAGGRDVRTGSWGAEHRRLTVGPGGRAVLALTENFNSGWKAELNGTSLRAVRVDGWRQAWAVPAGRGGNVELTFAPGGGYRLGLIVGAMAVAALVGLATVRGRLRRHAESALAAGVPPGWAAPALAGGLALVVGGPLVVLVPLAVVAHRAKPRWTAAVAGLAYAAAGAVVVWQPGRLPGSEAGAFGPLAQALTVLALVMLTLVTVRRE